MRIFLILGNSKRLSVFLKNFGEKLKGIIIADPPYPELEEYREIGTTTRLKKVWFPVVSWSEIGLILGEILSLFVESHIYIWANTKSLCNAIETLKKIQAKFWNILVWHKKKLGMGYHYRNSIEFLVFGEKGKRKLRDLSLSNFFIEKPDPNLTRIHPTAKPVGVQKKIIMNSIREGDIVVDPFCGIGTSLIATIKAVRELGLKNITYVGADIVRDFLLEASKLAKKFGLTVEFLEL